MQYKLEKEETKMASVRARTMRRFALNITRKRLAVGLCPSTLGELTALPSPLAGSKGKGWRGRTGKAEGRK